jgi:hypothetical protein
MSLLGYGSNSKLFRTTSRAQGIKYSLTLHDKSNKRNKRIKRIMGFDNSHEIEYGAKKDVSPKRMFDHWHYDENDQGRVYHYTNTGQLLKDFWKNE